MNELPLKHNFLLLNFKCLVFKLRNWEQERSQKERTGNATGTKELL